MNILQSLSTGTIGAIVGFMLSQAFIQYFEFSRFKENTEITKKIAMIQLGRDLVKEFNEQEFKKIRMSLEECKSFEQDPNIHQDEIRSYLNFFNNLGFYYDKQVIELDFIDQHFGGYIIQAHENRSLNQFVNYVRDKQKQEKAYEYFLKLAITLEHEPHLTKTIELLRKSCLPKA